MHAILGTDEVDVTARAAGPRAGTVRTLWTTHDAALAAAEVLATVGPAWVLDVPERAGLSMLMQVTGEVSEVALSDDGAAWAVDLGVQEVSA